MKRVSRRGCIGQNNADIQGVCCVYKTLCEFFPHPGKCLSLNTETEGTHILLSQLFKLSEKSPLRARLCVNIFTAPQSTVPCYENK